MRNHSNCLSSFGLLLLLAFVALTEIAEQANASKLNLANLAKYLPDKHDGKLIRTELKIILSKLNVRRVPLTKKHAERALAKLYKEEREILEDMGTLKKNLQVVDNNNKRNSMRVLQIDTHQGASNDRDGVPKMRRPQIKLTEVTQKRIDNWRSELEIKEEEYKDIREKILETKNLIKDPEQYISVPHSYGRIEPEKERENERDLLIQDRQAMEWRRKIITSELEPSWLVDSW